MTPRLIVRIAFGLLFLSLAACGDGGALPTGHASATGNVATGTAPAQSATPIPAGSAPTPTNVPAGWQVFAGPNFSMAYPPGWRERTTKRSDAPMLYSFQSTTDAQGGQLSVYASETGGLDATTVATLCRAHAGDQLVTFAGLPMRYSVASPGERDWVFIANTATSYILTAPDATLSPDVQARNGSILSTFRPQETTPGCS
jgi:hypothetical protein